MIAAFLIIDKSQNDSQQNFLAGWVNASHFYCKHVAEVPEVPVQLP